MQLINVYVSRRNILVLALSSGYVVGLQAKEASRGSRESIFSYILMPYIFVSVLLTLAFFGISVYYFRIRSKTENVTARRLACVLVAALCFCAVLYSALWLLSPSIEKGREAALDNVKNEESSPKSHGTETQGSSGNSNDSDGDGNSVSEKTVCGGKGKDDNAKVSKEAVQPASNSESGPHTEKNDVLEQKGAEEKSEGSKEKSGRCPKTAQITSPDQVVPHKIKRQISAGTKRTGEAQAENPRRCREISPKLYVEGEEQAPDKAERAQEGRDYNYLSSAFARAESMPSAYEINEAIKYRLDDQGMESIGSKGNHFDNSACNAVADSDVDVADDVNQSKIRKRRKRSIDHQDVELSNDIARPRAVDNGGREGASTVLNSNKTGSDSKAVGVSSQAKISKECLRGVDRTENVQENSLITSDPDLKDKEVPRSIGAETPPVDRALSVNDSEDNFNGRRMLSRAQENFISVPEEHVEMLDEPTPQQLEISLVPEEDKEDYNILSRNEVSLESACLEQKSGASALSKGMKTDDDKQEEKEESVEVEGDSVVTDLNNNVIQERETDTHNIDCDEKNGDSDKPEVHYKGKDQTLGNVISENEKASNVDNNSQVDSEGYRTDVEDKAQKQIVERKRQEDLEKMQKEDEEQIQAVEREGKQDSEELPSRVEAQSNASGHGALQKDQETVSSVLGEETENRKIERSCSDDSPEEHKGRSGDESVMSRLQTSIAEEVKKRASYHDSPIHEHKKIRKHASVIEMMRKRNLELRYPVLLEKLGDLASNKDFDQTKISALFDVYSEILAQIWLLIKDEETEAKRRLNDDYGKYENIAKEDLADMMFMSAVIRTRCLSHIFVDFLKQHALHISNCRSLSLSFCKTLSDLRETESENEKAREEQLVLLESFRLLCIGFENIERYLLNAEFGHDRKKMDDGGGHGLGPLVSDRLCLQGYILEILEHLSDWQAEICEDCGALQENTDDVRVLFKGRVAGMVTAFIKKMDERTDVDSK